jgi:hypothetical protein
MTFYELLVEILAVNYIIKKESIRKRKFKSKKNQISLVKNGKLIYILMLLCVFLIFVYSGYFIENVHFLGFKSSYISDENFLIKKGSISILAFNLFRYLFSILILCNIYRKKIGNNRKMFYSIAVIIFFSLFVTGNSRSSIMYYLIPFISLLIYLYPTKLKITLTSLILIFAVVATLSTFFKYSTKIRIEDDSVSEHVFSYKSLNAYFSGPDNIRIGLKATENISSMAHLVYFCNDNIANFPVLSKYSTGITTTKLFNRYFYSGNDVVDQIAPLGVFASAHFSKFFYPIYHVIFLFLAYYIERKSKRSSNILHKVLLMYVMYYFSMFMVMPYSIIITSPIYLLMTYFPVFFLRDRKYNIK